MMQAALSARKESTLKVILSAVWNLSAHCSINKVGSLHSGKLAIRVLACTLLLLLLMKLIVVTKLVWTLYAVAQKQRSKFHLNW